MSHIDQRRRGPYAKSATTAVKRFRQALKLTQADAAKRCGVPLRTFQRADAGDTMDMTTRRRIERALGASW